MTTDMRAQWSNAKVDCPACAGAVAYQGDVVLNEIIECDECGTELEVVSLEPPLLALAPEVEEDWGE